MRQFSLFIHGFVHLQFVFGAVSELLFFNIRNSYKDN